MLRNIFAYSILVFLFSVVSAQADEDKNGFYLGGFAGLGFLNKPGIEFIGAGLDTIMNSKKGFNGGEAIGYRFKSIRLEAELGYASNNSTELPLNSGTIFTIKAQTTALSYLANIYYDCRLLSDKFTPYIFAGIGGAKITFKEDVLSIIGSSNVFAYKIGFGVEGEVTKHLSLYSGYSYFGTSDYKVTDSRFGLIKFDYRRHNINFGFRYYF